MTGDLRALTAAALLVAALALSLAVPARAQCEGDECRLIPPESQQVNPHPISGASKAGESESSGSPRSAALGDMPLVSADSLQSSGSESQEEAAANAQGSEARGSALSPESSPSVSAVSSFDIRMRYQDPSDISCGVQALGMALDGLDAAGPTSGALLSFLEDRGLMYDFGTGVEELAYAAQSFGYEWSFAFYRATLDQLRAELAAGRPVVVSLGANGEGLPGHFVTVTGFSSDGLWVAYNDPILGEQVVSMEEFQRLWALQGNAGVSVLKEVPAGAPDYRPWVAFAAALMGLLSLTPLGRQRKGIGAGTNVRYEPYTAYRTETRVVKKRVKETYREPYTAYRTEARTTEKWVQETYRQPYTAYRTAYRTVPKTTYRKRTVGRKRVRYVRRQKRWYERGLFGRLVSRVRTWVEPVVEWFTETVWEPVTTWVREAYQVAYTAYRKATRWVKKKVTELVKVPYTAYRTATRWVEKAVEKTVRVPYTAYRVVREAAEEVDRVVDQAEDALVSVAERVETSARQAAAAPLIAAHDAVEAATPWAQRTVATALGSAADSLKSIADPQRNPQTAAWRAEVLDTIDESLDGWGQAGEGFGALVDYTVDAVKDGDASRVFTASAAWNQARNETAKETGIATAKAVGGLAWGILSTPYRLVTQSIPNFFRAGRERMEGKDRTWDVLFTGTMLEADLVATYGLLNATGVSGRLNNAARNSSRPTNVPEIKPGVSGGETAYGEFPASVRQAWLTQEPTQTCVYCGRLGRGTQLDHAHPRALGGNAGVENAQWACPHCNASKGATLFPKTPPDQYIGPWPPKHWPDRLLREYAKWLANR